ncbi:hypothetical protein [Deinococcus sp.]|uniref:hypothetical protein n=1 Tax=Deinococcus sp. TaxID=47478 RepID=UPI002869A0E5|nr:hypothetical protein [Deinococcus sp.]
MTPDNHEPLPVNSTLLPHQSPVPEHQPAAQGPMPNDLPAAPHVQRPSGQHLSAQEVTDLVGGGDASIVEANEALEQAEGIDPITES